MVPPTSCFGLGSEFPEVMIVCSKGVMSFTLAVGHARISDPTVKTAITACDADFGLDVSFIPLFLPLRGVTKL
uniref:Uncharacterized protein n=1 Tax=Arundo donax TaxID=35708 RepID=A0A0A9E775_ARUDO